ncbi:uncharacterized protein LOC120292974 [Eucalyptus grandis]|uniref:uncharacterized protein LOC120292974 n=1 Tax=Eucalyptus grandis TaxID=71139 RepID=UPI00192E8290|nr:uncharacterized protein LOC120292974 [Eucalyptus grandis]
MATSSEYDYEVFLSFRGPDSRAGFTDFLYTNLKDVGICTFRDDEELRVGEEFAPELLQAINQSKISIPIFSKGYASSVWCLKELVQMVSCQKAGRQKIMPIFYDVAPSEVRHQTGGYGEALDLHKKKQRYDKETISQWEACSQCNWEHKRMGLAWKEGEQGQKEVEALCLKFDHERRYHFTYEDFKSLSNLRFLEVDDSKGNFGAEETLLWHWHELPSNVLPTNVFQENLDLLPQLRWLSWHNISPMFNITNFSMEDLVILDLSKSRIRHDLEGVELHEGTFYSRQHLLFRLIRFKSNLCMILLL